MNVWIFAFFAASMICSLVCSPLNAMFSLIEALDMKVVPVVSESRYVLLLLVVIGIDRPYLPEALNIL